MAERLDALASVFQQDTEVLMAGDLGSRAQTRRHQTSFHLESTSSAGSTEGERESAREHRSLLGDSSWLDGAEPLSTETTTVGGLLFLDSIALSRPKQERCIQGAKWLTELAGHTEAYRERRAQHHRMRRAKKVNLARLQGYSEQYAADSGRWDAQRERGQREKFQRVRDCGERVVEIKCQSCERVHEMGAGCRIGLICVPCRARRVQEKRAKFEAARAVVLADATARGLLTRHRHRWFEQFITLTVPHDPGDSVIGRIERVANAWRRFLKRLNRHWKSRGVKSAQFFRCLEWTPGKDADKLGHPHIHFWLFGPEVYEEYLRTWWEKSLLEEGLPVSWKGRVNWPDMKPVDNGPGAAAELIKYLTKDIDVMGHKISAEIYAKVYEAFDGRRISQASRGFMGLGKGERRCDCGSTLPKRIRLKNRESDEAAE